MPLLFRALNPITGERLLQITDNIITIFASKNETFAEQMRSVVAGVYGQAIKSYETAHCGLHQSANEFYEPHFHFRMNEVDPQTLNALLNSMLKRWEAFYPTELNPFAVFQDPTYRSTFDSLFAEYYEKSRTPSSALITQVADYFQSQCAAFSDPNAYAIVERYHGIDYETFLKKREVIALDASHAQFWDTTKTLFLYAMIALFVMVIIGAIIAIIFDNRIKPAEIPTPAPATRIGNEVGATSTKKGKGLETAATKKEKEIGTTTSITKGNEPPPPPTLRKSVYK